MRNSRVKNEEHLTAFKWAMILAVMNAIYAIAYIEAWKIQDFNWVWTHELTIQVLCSNQLSYEATDFRCCSFVGSNEPVRNVKLYMKYFIYWNQQNRTKKPTEFHLPLPTIHKTLQSKVSFSKTSKSSATIPKLNTYFLYHHSFHSNATKT